MNKRLISEYTTNAMLINRRKVQVTYDMQIFDFLDLFRSHREARLDLKN